MKKIILIFILALNSIPIITNAKEIKEEVFIVEKTECPPDIIEAYTNLVRVSSTSKNGFIIEGTAQTYIWTQSGGHNTYQDITFTLEYDQDGNLINETKNKGEFEVVKFPYEDIEIVNENNDASIIKYDENSNILWEDTLSGSNIEYFNDVVKTSDDGLLVIGGTTSTDIEGITNRGEADAVIIKYDKNGNIEWQQSYGGSGYESYNGVLALENNGYIAVGCTASTDIDAITKDDNQQSALIVKYDANGNIEWQKIYEASMFNDLALTNTGKLIVVGSKSNGEYANGYILKLSYAYDLQKEDTQNGTFDLVQEYNKGKITITPDEGYELDKIHIINSKGEALEYKEENSNYYFDLDDDVTVKVTYKAIEGNKSEVKPIITNPNTKVGAITLLLGLGVIAFISIGKGFKKIKRLS